VTLPRKGIDTEEGRAVVVGDSDVFSDVVLDANVGNRVFAVDSVRWLLGEEALGAAASETDTPLYHTRGQDVAWFYGTVFVAPALVLGAGVWLTRRRRVQR